MKYYLKTTAWKMVIIMAKLYELADSYAQLLDMIDNEEVSFEDIRDTLESIEDVAEEKFENIAKLIKLTEGDIDLFKSEENRIASRRKTMENKVKSLKSYLVESLDRMQKKSVEAGTFKIRKQKNPDTIYISEGATIPEEYLIPQEALVNNKALKEAVLKEGKEIEGVSKAPETFHIRIN